MTSETGMTPLSQILETLVEKANYAESFPEELFFTKVDTAAAVAAKEHAVNLKAELEGLLERQPSKDESLPDHILQQIAEKLHPLAIELHSIWSDYTTSAESNEEMGENYWRRIDILSGEAERSRDKLADIVHRLAVVLRQKAEMPETVSITFKVNRDIAESFARLCKEEQASPDRLATAALLRQIEGYSRASWQRQLEEVELGREICFPHNVGTETE